MDAMTVGEFLRTRRARLTPAEVGLVDYGTRRVPGLRREEVAMLAEVSVTYYTRLEQGQANGASDSVLASLARALKLSPVETQHLFDLATAPRQGVTSLASTRPDFARPGTLRLIDNMTDVPCVLLGKRTELLAWNHLGHRLIAAHLEHGCFRDPARRPNLTRMLFADEPTRRLYPEWDVEASRAVASLRLLSGRFSDDAQLAALIGELTLQSTDFARLWNEHPVDNCMSGVKIIDHPEVGRMDLDFEVLSMPDGSGQRLLTYTAERGSRDAARLQQLSAQDPESASRQAI